MVTIECSATKCKYKKNDCYYGICSNPLLQDEYRMFEGGRVKVSGCDYQDTTIDSAPVPDTLEVGITLGGAYDND